MLRDGLHTPAPSAAESCAVWLISWTVVVVSCTAVASSCVAEACCAVAARISAAEEAMAWMLVADGAR